MKAQSSGIEKGPIHADNSLGLSILVPLYNERYLVESSVSRLLSVQSDFIKEIEVIIVDDGSTDGSWETVQNMAGADRRIKLFRHERNQGKGAAVRTALFHATKEICVIHDADMEYNPEDLPLLLRPFLGEGADAVFGSRYLDSPSRRVLEYRHSLLNKWVTLLVSWVTDFDLTDVETCYKMVKTRLLKSIPLHYNDFRFEIELTVKLAKRRTRIFEVPIRYLPRSHEEGKKIRFADGLLALLAVLQLSVVEDLYHPKAYGLKILHDMNQARRFNRWMADNLKPYLGERILEIRAGIGTLTNEFIPRELYVAGDINRHAIEFLRSYSVGKPYLRVHKIDACRPEDFLNFEEQFDTVLMVNVLEHVPDDRQALRNIYFALRKGGRAVLLVPQHPSLYGSFDKVLHHHKRYTREELIQACQETGFEIESVFDFNRFNVPSWFLNAKILQRKRFSRVQLKILETLMPFIRRIDRYLPWGGLSLIAIARK